MFDLFFGNSFSENVPTSSSPLRSSVTYVYDTVFLIFLIMNSSSIWSVTFCNNAFIFRYSNMITNFQFRTFAIICNMKVNIYTWLNVSKLFLLFCHMSYCIYQQYHIIYQYTHFWYCSYIFIDSILQDSKKSFSNCWFPFNMCWINLYVIVL